LNDPLVLEQGSFCIPLDYQNSFSFQFQPKREKPKEIKNFEVPIFLSDQAAKDYHKIVEVSSDLLQNKIHPHINGTKHVAQIAIDAKMDLEIVKMCL
jgi:Nitrogen permease regulator 2